MGEILYAEYNGGVDFFCLIPETPFLGNLAQKIETVCLNWICYLDWFEYAEFNGDVHFFCFWLEIPFLSKLCRKNQNCEFKLKFGT